MRVLLIDHYDSFTYNLAQLLASVTGFFPTVIAHDQIQETDLEQMPEIEAIVLGPGPGRADRIEDSRVSSWIFQSRFSILGICLGHQALALSQGAELRLLDKPAHGIESKIEHRGQGLFKGIPNQFTAVRYHSWHVKLSESIHTNAWVSDNTSDKTTMGIDYSTKTQARVGLQFHPESVATEYGTKLIENFCQMVKQRQ